MWGKKKIQASTHHEILEYINESIRQGKGTLAKSALISINTKKLNNAEERIRFANLATRLSLPEEALKLLHPFVRPKGKFKLSVTEEELLEYAVALIKIDASAEALTVLKTLNSKALPKVLLYTAFAHIENWDYEEAAKWLKKYSHAQNISPYEKLVAHANLCEALTYLNDPEATITIQSTLIEAEDLNFKIIIGHVYLIKCIHAFELKNWEEASDALTQAEKYFLDLDTLNAFFVRKWRAILELYTSEKHSLKALHAIRIEAEEKWKHWGTVRDCDFYEAIFTVEENLIQRLYFGTPYPSFRKRLMRFLGRENDIKLKSYTCSLNNSLEKGKVFEFFSGKSSERESLLNSGGKVLSLLRILASDFYRPKRLVYIFSKLYPTEHFNPNSSPGRVRNVIRRIRLWVKENRFPFYIAEEKGMYHLASTNPVSLIIPLDVGEFASGEEKTLHKTDLLQSLLVEKPSFTALEACLALKLPRRSSIRVIAQALEMGLITRSGKGKNTVYTWVVEKPPSLKAA